MMFTRRHYQFTAETIALTVDPIDATVIWADRFKRDNPRFDEARFINAVYAALLGEADVSVDYLNQYQARFGWAFR